MRWLEALLLVSVIVAGCDGGDGEHDAVETGLVTVTVLVGGLPASGEDVVFHDPDGNVLEHLVTGTDGSGSVSRMIDRGEMVTVAHLDEYGDRELVTLSSLVPLEELRFEFFSWDAPVVTTAEITADPVPGATDYIADYPCGLSFSSDPSFAPELEADCLDSAGRLDLGLTAKDDAGVPLAWSVRTDIPVVEGGTTTIAMPAWSSVFADLAVDIAADATTAAVGTIYVGTVVQRHVQVGFASTTFAELPFSATLPILPPGPERSRLAMILTSDSWLIDIDSDTGGFSVPASDLLAPPVAAADDFGTARPLASWSGTVPSSVDATLVRLFWDDGSSWNTWSVFRKPAGSGSCRLPALPDVLASFRPESVDSADMSVQHIESSAFFGYGDVRRGGHQEYLDFPDGGAPHYRARFSWDAVEFP